MANEPSADDDAKAPYREGGEGVDVQAHHTVHFLGNTGLSRTYLIEGEGMLVAVDVGSIGAAMDVEAYITGQMSRSMNDLKAITATHFHIDHIGGIGRLLGRSSDDARVWFHARVRDYIEGTRKPSLIRHWFSGLVPATIASLRYIRRPSHLAFEMGSGIPLPIIRTMTRLPFKRERIDYFGGASKRRYALHFGGWEVIETPGHTEDSVSFYSDETGELICGDLIVNIEKRGKGKLNRFYWRKEALLDSYTYLCEATETRVIYPGHGDVIAGVNNVLPEVNVFQ